MRAHQPTIESHVHVIDRNGGPTCVAARLQHAGVTVRQNTVACWVTRNSIPRLYWPAFERAEMATVAALAAAHERRLQQRAEIRRHATTGAQL